MESGDGGSKSDQLGDLPVQIRQLLGQKVAHMRTGRLAGVTDAQDVTDLGQGQPRATTAANEIEPRDCFVPIGPVPIGRSLSGGEQSPVFVKPQGFGRHANSRGRFTNAHYAPVHFDGRNFHT